MYSSIIFHLPPASDLTLFTLETNFSESLLIYQGNVVCALFMSFLSTSDVPCLFIVCSVLPLILDKEFHFSLLQACFLLGHSVQPLSASVCALQCLLFPLLSVFSIVISSEFFLAAEKKLTHTVATLSVLTFCGTIHINY